MPPEIKRAPSRFRHALSKQRIVITGACDNCGLCVDLCPRGVYRAGRKRPRVAEDYLCQGPSCQGNEFHCLTRCPQEAIRINPNPSFEVLGDHRWTADLLASTWYMAESGEIPYQDLNYKTGDSGGGFDKLRLLIPPGKALDCPDEDISLELDLNRTGDGRPEITIPVPFYLGGMSFGSVSIHSMLSRVRAATAWGSFCCTGEGGYPDDLIPYDDHLITQVATGLFGVREETIQRVRIVEFKYAQGAKPGLGGHLLGDKVTPEVARMREAVVGTSLFSPFPFHSVYSVEDHKKHIDWIKAINPRALVSVKVSTPTDVDMVAVGSYFAGAHILQLDGSYGGTGAAPDIAKKNIAMPLEYAVPKVHKFLKEEGIRDKITIIASGGIRTAFDMAKIIALGADGICLGTLDLVSLECLRCHNCESGRGCARGIATTDPELTNLIATDWGTQRIINTYAAWMKELRRLLKRLGLRRLKDLVGRWDLLVHLDYVDPKTLDGELE
ncbi:MAG: FMN-binding glutamate synthase family protein [Deltaproteobacteria bacterium]|nr:FMN-binding glutamate synthase family protein [Deltaproteobacteria bacterium]